MFDLYKIDSEGVRYPSREMIQQRIAKDIAMDCDGKIAESLIRMGWTPPHGEGGRHCSDPNDIVNRLMASAGQWCIYDGETTTGSTLPDVAAKEIIRLRTVLRVNLLRLAPSTSHAEIDAVVYPDTPTMPE